MYVIVEDEGGLGWIISQNAYWDWHHVAGHTLLAGVVVAGALTAIAQPRRLLAFFVYLALFHVHFLLDFFGSGPKWGIPYLWPMRARQFETSLAWGLFSWQNIVAGYALVACTIWIAYRHRRTPLESIMPRLDAQLVALLPCRRDCQPTSPV